MNKIRRALEIQKQLIENLTECYIRKNGIQSLEHADFDVDVDIVIELVEVGAWFLAYGGYSQCYQTDSTVYSVVYEDQDRSKYALSQMPYSEYFPPVEEILDGAGGYSLYSMPYYNTLEEGQMTVTQHAIFRELFQLDEMYSLEYFDDLFDEDYEGCLPTDLIKDLRKFLEIGLEDCSADGVHFDIFANNLGWVGDSPIIFDPAILPWH